MVLVTAGLGGFKLPSGATISQLIFYLTFHHYSLHVASECTKNNQEQNILIARLFVVITAKAPDDCNRIFTAFKSAECSVTLIDCHKLVQYADMNENVTENTDRSVNPWQKTSDQV